MFYKLYRRIYTSIEFFILRQRMNLRFNIQQLLIVIDQFFNVLVGTLIGSKSYADETLSSRCWRWKKDGIRSWPCNLVDTLFFFDTLGDMKHCEWCYMNEQERKHSPPEQRP